jgi:LmbE family N-acetylglucosaminyl deacetylase
MFKKMISLLLVSVLVLCGFSNVSEASRKQKVVYYVPHQDDELLGMGVSIINHVKSGHDVHLVLMTNGTNSNVRKKMHMSPRQFQQARNKEFTMSARMLGVKRSNLHFENLQDGSVTKEQMKNVIMKYENRYPNAKHKAHSYYDKHNDHRSAGQALNELFNEGKINDARFYVNYGRYDTKGITEKLATKSVGQLRMSAGAYNIKSSKGGFYGIGYISAGSEMFKNVVNNPINIYHLPNYTE